jgi:hypothetical protein
MSVCVCMYGCMHANDFCMRMYGWIHTLIKIGRGFLFNKYTMYTSVCMDVYTYVYVYVYIYTYAACVCMYGCMHANDFCMRMYGWIYLDQDWEGFSIQQRYHVYKCMYECIHMYGWM